MFVNVPAQHFAKNPLLGQSPATRQQQWRHRRQSKVIFGLKLALRLPPAQMQPKRNECQRSYPERTINAVVFQK
jgi:hypothetical protein